MMSVAGEPGTTWNARVPTKVADSRYFDPGVLTGGTFYYDVPLDGKRFLMIKDVGNIEQPQTTTSSVIVVVQHWYHELKRLVPTR